MFFFAGTRPIKTQRSQRFSPQLLPLHLRRNPSFPARSFAPQPRRRRCQLPLFLFFKSIARARDNRKSVPKNLQTDPHSTRNRHAAPLSSSSREQLDQHNRMPVLELEEARARVRVLQVCNSAPCTLFLVRCVCRMPSSPWANAPGCIKENRFPAQVEARARLRAAGGRELAPLSLHEQHR